MTDKVQVEIKGDVATISDDGALDIQIAVVGSTGSTGTERAAQ